MREIRSTIDITATPERVWQVLLDFDAYPEWNPFIPSLVGEAVEGNRLVVRLDPPGGRGMTFKPTVMRVEAGATFRWLGHLMLPRIFDGEHIFELEPHEGGTRFTQREEFRGVLVTPLLAMVAKSTEAGFTQMNEALKARVESRQTGTS